MHHHNSRVWSRSFLHTLKSKTFSQSKTLSKASAKSVLHFNFVVMNGSLLKLPTDHCLFSTRNADWCFVRGVPWCRTDEAGRSLPILRCMSRAWYCSTTCQRYHWSTEHRDTCVGYAVANFVKQLKLPDLCAALILWFAWQRDAPSAASLELRSFLIQHRQEIPAWLW